MSLSLLLIFHKPPGAGVGVGVRATHLYSPFQILLLLLPPRYFLLFFPYPFIVHLSHYDHAFTLHSFTPTLRESPFPTFWYV